MYVVLSYLGHKEGPLGHLSEVVLIQKVPSFPFFVDLIEFAAT